MIEFTRARDALDAGDLPALAGVLDEHPHAIHHRGEHYSGYFAGATLLHHVAGNPIRCPLPANIVEITRLLLDRGADPNAPCGEDGDGRVVGLLLTSRAASEAGVAVALIDLLIGAGARADLADPDILSGPLWNVARATAEALADRGAPMDLRHAAALGRVDVVAGLLDAGVDEVLPPTGALGTSWPTFSTTAPTPPSSTGGSVARRRSGRGTAGTTG